MAEHFHIVTAAHGISGAMTYAATLDQMLRDAGGTTTIWLDEPGTGNHRAGKPIQSFSGQFPRGGTLVLVGTYLKFGPWLNHARPRRLILICNTSDPDKTFRTMARLKEAALPPVEIVYVSTRLRDSTNLPGRVCPEIINTEIFTPLSQPKVGSFTIGRLSRDEPDKHHSDDPTLYRLLAWNGTHVRIMGGICLQATLRTEPNITLLPAGSIEAQTFLQSLDVFFYRTGPRLHEAAGRVIMEALACGLPVVAHVSGGYTDWIRHGENGFLFEQQEEAWQYLKMLKDDSRLRLRLGIEARRTAEELGAIKSQPGREYMDWLFR